MEYMNGLLKRSVLTTCKFMFLSVYLIGGSSKLFPHFTEQDIDLAMISKCEGDDIPTYSENAIKDSGDLSLQFMLFLWKALVELTLPESV